MSKIKKNLSRLTIYFFALSNSFFAFASNTWTEYDYNNAKTMLLSGRFIENGNGVAIIRKNPAIYFHILNSYLADINNNNQCSSSNTSYEPNLKKIFEYTTELTSEQFDSILTELLSTNSHLEKIKQDSCAGVNRIIQDVIFDLTKYRAKNEELDRIKKVREEQDRLESERKRLAEEENNRKRISEDNKNSTSVAKGLSESLLCEVLGASIHMRTRSYVLPMFGAATNVKEVVEREVKRRKLRVNFSLVEKQSVPLGSSYCQVYASLGMPDDINTSEGAWGINQQLVYRGTFSTKYIYFKNGVMSSIQY